MYRLLIVEDEESTRDVLNRFLAPDYDVTLAPDGNTALPLLTSGAFDAVLTDLRMDGADGFAVLEAAKTAAIPCVVFTAYGSIETAVEAMRRGAYDFVTKPISFDRLELLLQRLFEQQKIKDENSELKRRLKLKTTQPPMIGRSKAMQQIIELIRQVAPSRSTVLITGESGTGKELVAQMIHDESGRKGPFVPVHCAALPETLLEAELFGHEKGAFTGAHERRTGRFETASDGTLFLDEIGEISPTVQVKLLRVLESRTFERIGGTSQLKTDARIVTATNRDLAEMTKTGKFREDLFFRLDVVRVHLPPLRERRDDIPLLIRHFLDVFAAENNKSPFTITDDAVQRLCTYDWPGNIRELRNCIERMVVLARNTELTSDNIPYSIRSPQTQSAHPAAPAPAPLPLDLSASERELIIRAIQVCNGNRTRAAEMLGISRRTLHRKINDYNIPL